MNTLDWVILAFLGYGFIRGVFRGLVKEIFGLLGLIIGITIGFIFSDGLAHVLVDLGLTSERWARPMAFLALFVTVVIISRLLAHILSKSLSWAALGPVNAFLGGLFGLAKWVLVLTVVLVFIYSGMKNAGLEVPGIFSDSTIYPELSRVGDWLVSLF